MEQRTNVGYVITDSVHIGDTEFVIGQSENDPARFVTWACDNGDYYTCNNPPQHQLKSLYSHRN